MIYIMGAEEYEDSKKNYGDCIVYIEKGTAIIYDCGSEEHAKRVIELLDENGIDKAIVVLSHNDSDHFQGIPYLIEKKRVESVFTVLLLKYKDKLLKTIDDDRRNEISIIKTIKDTYDNIASLSGRVKLKDIYENENELPYNTFRLGPDFDYMIAAAAKELDSREGDTIDNERVVNATSVQIGINFGSNTILLTGDCTPAAIPEDVDLTKFDYIQLPHHGKPELAEEIFKRADKNIDITYIISDNTGASNGGSDNRSYKGHKYKNTRTDGDIRLDNNTSRPSYTGHTIGL